MGDIRRTACAASCLVVVLAGCTDGGSGRPEPRSRTTPPAELCAGIVARWAKDALKPGGGDQSDYQQKGLSDRQNTLVLKLSEEARRIRADEGRRAAHAFVEREARERCAALSSESPASSGGWPG
ncbi:hypothetical protein [Streptomyces sp. NPDC048172]|uniref:hypothetical protein n=1 Tax=Streptomyces sp. NPDC048172 TaxID=3365505 RepID=UPI00371A7C72